MTDSSPHNDAGDAVWANARKEARAEQAERDRRARRARKRRLDPMVQVCQFTSGTGCPSADGGAHYFAHIDPSSPDRICIDCGEPEAEA